jgi:hypothetical protein
MEIVLAGPISASAAGSSRWIRLVAKMTPEPKNLVKRQVGLQGRREVGGGALCKLEDDAWDGVS